MVMTVDPARQVCLGVFSRGPCCTPHTLQFSELLILINLEGTWAQMQEADDTRRKLPSEESVCSSLLLLLSLSDLLDSGPCPPKVSPPFAPLWFS